MTIPIRIRRSRRAGFNLPPNTVIIDRTGKYGNPFRVVYQKPDEVWNTPAGWYVTDGIKSSCAFDDSDAALEESLFRFDKWARRMLAYNPAWLDELKAAEFIACPCSVTEKCHGDIYIKLLREQV